MSLPLAIKYHLRCVIVPPTTQTFVIVFVVAVTAPAAANVLLCCCGCVSFMDWSRFMQSRGTTSLPFTC